MGATGDPERSRKRRRDGMTDDTSPVGERVIAPKTRPPMTKRHKNGRGAVASKRDVCRCNYRNYDPPIAAGDVCVSANCYFSPTPAAIVTSSRKRRNSHELVEISTNTGTRLSWKSRVKMPADNCAV